jgi:hypothetical protein
MVEQVIRPKEEQVHTCSFPSSGIIRKPVMYLYNMTGLIQSMAVDFKGNKLADSVPEIRKDNKIVFNLSTDGFINDKYDYLYYEFIIDKDIPRATYYAYVRNDSQLMDDLTKLANMSSLFGREASDFAVYWNLELKRNECKFYKVEIYDEDKLNKLFPIEVYPAPDFFIRRYFKFTPIDKPAKTNISLLTDKFKSRSGAIRVVEWGGWIDGSESIK